jgi:hypothetical protein
MEAEGEVEKTGMMGTEVGVVQSQAYGSSWPPKAGRSEESILPWKFQKEPALPTH